MATLEEELQRLKDAGASISEITQKIQEFGDQSIRVAKRAATTTEDMKNALQEVIDKRKEELAALREKNKELEREFNNASKISSQYEKAKEVNESLLEILQQRLKSVKGNVAMTASLKVKIKQAKKEQIDLIDAEKEYNEELAKAKQNVSDITDGLKSMASGDILGGLKKIGKTLATGLGDKYLGAATTKLKKKMKEMGVELSSSGLIEGIASLGSKLPGVATGASSAGSGMAGMTATLAPLGAGLGVVAGALFIVLPLLIALAVALGVTAKIAQFALELEDSARELTKVTGLSKDFSSAMLENADSLKEFGATSKDINAAVTALNATFTDFSMLNTASASKVKDTTVVLGKLGMSADDAAKGFQALAKGFAQTPEQAANTMLELDAVARDLGVSTAKMGADFAGASTQLQKLSGPEAMQAFKQLAVVSKATGIEVSRLLAITEKFDTFEGAATQAGKLNAALGGNFVNAMELMTATNPVERFEMIRDSILDSGLAFDDMSYYQKKFFADAAGMADVGELAMAMSGDFGAVGAEVGKTQADYEAAAKRAREFQSVQEQLANTMQSLIPVVKPLIKFIGEFTLAFSEFVLEYKDEIQAMFKGLMYFVGGLAVYFTIVNIPIIATVAAITALSAGIAYLLGLLGDLAAGLTGVRKATSVDHSSPTLLGGLEEMASSLGGVGDGAGTAMGSVDKLKAKMSSFRKELFSGDNNLIAGVEMTAAGMEGIGDASAKTAATMRATAPTIANNTAIKNATNNTTINNNSQGGGASGISIKFDNKKFADLFDVQVEKSIGRAARKAVV